VLTTLSALRLAQCSFVVQQVKILKSAFAFETLQSLQSVLTPVAAQRIINARLILTLAFL
jgi:hypothetical protein